MRGHVAHRRRGFPPGAVGKWPAKTGSRTVDNRLARALLRIAGCCSSSPPHREVPSLVLRTKVYGGIELIPPPQPPGFSHEYIVAVTFLVAGKAHRTIIRGANAPAVTFMRYIDMNTWPSHEFLRSPRTYRPGRMAVLAGQITDQPQWVGKTWPVESLEGGTPIPRRQSFGRPGVQWCAVYSGRDHQTLNKQVKSAPPGAGAQYGGWAAETTQSYSGPCCPTNAAARCSRSADDRTTSTGRVMATRMGAICGCCCVSLRRTASWRSMP